MGVSGPESPLSTTTSIALALTPVTSALRYFGSHGMWSSNHCACLARARMASVFAWFT